jgi:hypothetical protein
MKKPILRTAISVSSDTGMPIAAMTQVSDCLFSMITGKGHQKADKKHGVKGNKLDPAIMFCQQPPKR